MRRILACALLCAVLPLTSLWAQESDTSTSYGKIARVTVGLGVSYVGFGILGEFQPSRAPFTVLIGAGAGPVPGISPGGMSVGVRAYPMPATPLYVEVMGGSLQGETPYGPLLLVGIATGWGTSSTHNFALGFGRYSPVTWFIALDIGLRSLWTR